MQAIAKAWTRTWNWLGNLTERRRAELRLCVRVTVSALLTLGIGQLLHLPLVLWAVLTAVIVTQTSVGRSLKASIDYFIGTLGGAVYAGTIAALIPHPGEAALLAVLALAVAPLALIAAHNASFNVAPITAIIVVLAPTFSQSTPIESAFYRLVEVALGAGIGLAVSLTILPARAHALAIESAARMLDLVAQALQDLLKGFTGSLDAEAIRPIQEGIGRAIARLDVIQAEAQRERVTQLVDAPDPGPLLRTLLRLRHDLVIVGRAAVDPLPPALRPRLAGPLERLGAAASGYLHDCATALNRRTVAPPLVAVEPAFTGYAAEIGAIRRDGIMRALPGDALEHLFALSFAFDQVHQHLRDLERSVTEWAQPPKLARRQRID